MTIDGTRTKYIKYIHSNITIYIHIYIYTQYYIYTHTVLDAVCQYRQILCYGKTNLNKGKKEKHTDTVRNSSNSPHSKPQDLDVPRWPSSTRPWASPNIETCWQVQCKNEVCLCHKVSFWQKTRVTLGGRTASKGVPLTTASILHIAWAMQSYEDLRRAIPCPIYCHLMLSTSLCGQEVWLQEASGICKTSCQGPKSRHPLVLIRILEDLHMRLGCLRRQVLTSRQDRT